MKILKLITLVCAFIILSKSIFSQNQSEIKYYEGNQETSIMLYLKCKPLGKIGNETPKLAEAREKYAKDLVMASLNMFTYLQKIQSIKQEMDALKQQIYKELNVNSIQVIHGEIEKKPDGTITIHGSSEYRLWSCP